MNNKFPGTTINYLDANFPFMDKFPLLPHLSHNDGKKLDLSFQYNDSQTGQMTNDVPSFIWLRNLWRTQRGWRKQTGVLWKKGTLAIQFVTWRCFAGQQGQVYIWQQTDKGTCKQFCFTWRTWKNIYWATLKGSIGTNKQQNTISWLSSGQAWRPYSCSIDVTTAQGSLRQKSMCR